MNTPYSSNMETQTSKTLHAIQHIECKKAFPREPLNQLVKNMKELSVRENDPASEVLCARIEE